MYQLLMMEEEVEMEALDIEMREVLCHLSSGYDPLTMKMCDGDADCGHVSYLPIYGMSCCYVR